MGPDAMNDADINFCNLPAKRDGGMLAGGLFLREFVPGGVRWAHPDIAGPASSTGEAYGYTRQGRDRRGDADPRRANGPDPEPPLGVHEHESSGDRREHPLIPR
jgi:hypothetical protein